MTIRFPIGPALIDRDAFVRLLANLSYDENAHRRFANDFAALWDNRVDRLTEALRTLNSEESHVVLLSIRSTSTMIGAFALEMRAAQIHVYVKMHNFVAASALVPLLDDIGRRTCSEVTGLVSG